MSGKKRGAFSYIGSGLGYGVMLAAAMYLFYLGGKWLDARLGTEPLFMAAGLVLAIAATLKKMLNEITALGRDKK